VALSLDIVSLIQNDGRYVLLGGAWTDLVSRLRRWGSLKGMNAVHHLPSKSKAVILGSSCENGTPSLFVRHKFVENFWDFQKCMHYILSEIHATSLTTHSSRLLICAFLQDIPRVEIFNNTSMPLVTQLPNMIVIAAFAAGSFR
jgi:hypothetical protein